MLRILIVEDEPVNQEFLLLALKQHGECRVAPTGEDAVRLHSVALDEAQPYDVVFLDIQLPGISGLQTMEKLRALEDAFEIPEEKRACVIVTTALDDDRTASRAFIHGHAVAYLTKPFRARQVSEELRKLGLLDS